jgi:Icc-related predicted phosphoesterase
VDEQQRSVLANIHGHVHEASGMTWLGRVRVVNPGSLRYGGHFLVMTLVRHGALPWDIETLSFHTV